jgi:hypothetical protein
MPSVRNAKSVVVITCRLTVTQLDKLKARITETLPRTTRAVGAWIAAECGIEYQTPVGSDRSFAPPGDGTLQAESDLTQAGPGETDELHQGIPRPKPAEPEPISLM